jgi:Uma2 family endonuclease
MAGFPGGHPSFGTPCHDWSLACGVVPHSCYDSPMSTKSPQGTTLMESPPLRLEMSYAEFLEWHPETQMAEWIDGEAFIMAPPSTGHQDLTLFLGSIMRFYVESKGVGRVFVAPLQMRLGGSGREPTVLFVSNENKARVEGLYLNGPADLAVEIVSPESRGRDRKEKFREYEQAGVREYWILDALNRQAEFYALGPDRTYHPMAITEGVFRSQVIQGLWLDVK